MLKFNPNKSNCTGCAACYSVCPVHCITMVPDEEGFLYPEASSDACIKCNLCEKICPLNNEKKKNDYPKIAYAAVSKDYKIWHRSASGGAFSEIVRHWADKDTLIVGAAWNGLKVHHVGVIGFDNILPLCKSKYISSPVEETFKEIYEQLKKGGKAIFCGCPCQVDGLNRFLKKEYDNLLTIDLICHGQGSPLVFEKCMKFISNQLGEDVVSYEFRSKRKVYESDYLAMLTTNKSKYYIYNDPYIQLFLNQDALRPSCGENCKYRDIRRMGDITIADFKGLTKIYPDLLGTKRNWSTVVSNTKKGELISSSLCTTMQVRRCSIDDIIKYNPLFAHQTKSSENRKYFFEDFLNEPMGAIIKHTKPLRMVNNNLMRTIFNIAPSFLRKLYYKLRY